MSTPNQVYHPLDTAARIPQLPFMEESSCFYTASGGKLEGLDGDVSCILICFDGQFLKSPAN